MPYRDEMIPIARATIREAECTICLLRYPDGSYALVSGDEEDLVIHSVTLRPYVERAWAEDEVCLNVEDDRVTADDIAALVAAGVIAPPHAFVRSGSVYFPVARLLRTTREPGLTPDRPVHRPGAASWSPSDLLEVADPEDFDRWCGCGREAHLCATADGTDLHADR